MRPILCGTPPPPPARGMGSEAPVTGSLGSVVFKAQACCPGVTEVMPFRTLHTGHTTDTRDRSRL